jgi:F0F1-type ATP synthase alpha subunit
MQEGIKEGDKVKRTGQIASIKVGEGMVGRVVNTLGHRSTVKAHWLVSFMKCRWKEKHRV